MLRLLIDLFLATAGRGT